jgi:hypothetical protein
MKLQSVSVLLLFAAAAAALTAQGAMRPGRWETTVQMSMANMPIQMPEMKAARCVTAADLKKDPATGLPSGAPGDNSACKVSDYKESGSKVTWNMACTGQQPMTGTGELTFDGDMYTGLMKMNGQQGPMTMKLTGKRLGDCTQ